MHPSPQPISSRRLRWLLALPKFGVVLLLIAVAALLWLLHQNEQEEEQLSLIKDVLWLEQNLRFHLMYVKGSCGNWPRSWQPAGQRNTCSACAPTIS